MVSDFIRCTSLRVACQPRTIPKRIPRNDMMRLFLSLLSAWCCLTLQSENNGGAWTTLYSCGATRHSTERSILAQIQTPRFPAISLGCSWPSTARGSRVPGNNAQVRGIFSFAAPAEILPYPGQSWTKRAVSNVVRYAGTGVGDAKRETTLAFSVHTHVNYAQLVA